MGDFDADGKRDYASVGAPTARACQGVGPYTLRVEFASGRVLQRRLAGCDVHCSMSRATDFDRDGRNELLVVMGGGASTILLGVFSVVDGTLHRARLAPPDFEEPSFAVPHSPWAFGYGGSVTHLDSLFCRDDPEGRVVVRVQADNYTPPEDEYTVREHDLRFDGRDFHYLRSREYRVPLDSEHGRKLGGSGNEELCGAFSSGG